MMYKTGILCLLLGGLVPFAEALPLWIRPDAKSGAVSGGAGAGAFESFQHKMDRR